jgi:hypothetical protein
VAGQQQRKRRHDVRGFPLVAQEQDRRRRRHVIGFLLLLLLLPFFSCRLAVVVRVPGGGSVVPGPLVLVGVGVCPRPLPRLQKV